MKIEPPIKTKLRIPWKTILFSLGVTAFVLLFLGLSVALYYSLMRSQQTPAPFEIQTFVGDVKIRTSENTKWHKPTRGERLTVGDEIKNGKNAEIEFQIPTKIKLRLK